MNKLITAGLFASFSMGSSAQLIWQNDMCPDWTYADINGNTHNLYSYLDAGYTVFFAVSSTWCTPCWEHHTTRALDSLFLANGPGTTANNVMVFLIEADDNTGLDELHGISGSTLGDWVTGTAYPIIDNAQSIMPLLQTNWYGYVWGVCPNRMILPPGNITLNSLQQIVSICDDSYLADSPNDAALLYIPDYSSCNGSEPPARIRLQNVGTEPLTTAVIQPTINLFQDATNQLALPPFEWTGNLGTYEYEDLVVAQPSLPIGLHIVRLDLLNGDDTAVNDVMVQTIATSATAPGNVVTLEILTDNDAANTAWWLLQEEPAVTIDAVSLGTYANNTYHTYTWNLQDGECYSFWITDQAQNGISEPGYFKLYVNGVPFAEMHNFLFNTQIIEFMVDIDAGVGALVSESAITLAPNPMESSTILDLSEVHGAVELELFDATGRKSRTESLMGGGKVTVQRNGLAAGPYTVHLRTEHGQVRSGQLLVR